MAKNSFAADVTFKTCPQKSNKIIVFGYIKFVKLLKECPAFTRKILLKSITRFTSCVSLRLKTKTVKLIMETKKSYF